MENIHVKDFNKLKEILEDRKYYGIYGFYIGKVKKAEVNLYEHPNGATVHGRDGRWWIYVRAYGDKPNVYYDIALWKLRNTPIMEELVSSGVIEIKNKVSEENVIRN